MMSEVELLRHFADLIERNYQGSQKAFADASGISVPYVNDVLRGRRKPGAKILKAIGFRRVEMYEEVK